MRDAPPSLPRTVEVPAGAGVSRFHLARTPVTNAEYAAFVDTGRAPEPPFARDPAFARPDQPVVGVTWFEAAACAEWLSGHSGARWRLPSEAEWEHAARGGLEGASTPWGESIPLGEIPDGPLSAPWSVGRGTPNGYGLLDMGTIVHEWCRDWFDPETMTRRASRGGSWRHHVRWSRPSARSSLPPAYRYSDYGFRLLREV